MRHSFVKTTTRRSLQVILIAASLCATGSHDIAFGQDDRSGNQVRLTTKTLGMSGWQPEPEISVTTSRLGMTGWRRGPMTITTRTLGMTGATLDPIVVTTPGLGMTGAQRDPIAVTTRAFGMTGWADLPEACSAPFVRAAGGGCACPAGLLPAGGGACIAEGTGQPADIAVEIDGPEACAAGGRCPFDILIVNAGNGPFHGPMVVESEVSLREGQLSASNNGWSCAGGTCVRPRLTLAPGENETLTVDLQLPANAQTGLRLRQCAEMQAPSPGDAPVRFVQLMLTAAGFNVGPADNVTGQRTREGIEAFRRNAGLPSGPDIDEPLVAALQELVYVDPHPENDRSCTQARVAE